MESSNEIQKSQISYDDEDLQIVGVKVKLDGEEAYSFALDKAKSQSADTLIISANSNRVFSPYVVQKHHDSELQSKEKSSSIPVLQLKLISNCKENKEFEVNIKSKNDIEEAASENESLCCFGTKDTVVFSNTNPQVSYHIKSPKVSTAIPLKYVTEISTSETQTEHETKSTNVQTACVEVRQPTFVEEAAIQTDRTQNVSTATDEKNVKSVEIQTDIIPNYSSAIQTEEEAATGSSQTDTSVIYSIDRVYDASTQTEQTADAATSTDFDIYIVDRENVTEKAVDTEDLPFAPLMVAKEEKEETADKLTIEQKCYCSCGHRNHSCFHKEHGNVMPAELCQCPYQRLIFPSGISQCSFCHCPPSNCDMINTCDEDFRLDVHQQHCCKCKDLNVQTGESKPHQEALEKLKPAKCKQMKKISFKSLAVQEKTGNESRCEAAKNLEEVLKKTRIITAVKVLQPLKIENASILKIPVVIEHYLNSFNLSTYGFSPVVVNPVNITFPADQPKVFETESQLTAKVKLPMDRTLKDMAKKHLLMFLDGKKMKSVTFSTTPVTNDKQPQVCLCDKCFLNVHSVIREKQQSSTFCTNDKKDKPTSEDKTESASTSPRIKHKDFNYASKDMWILPDRNENVLNKKIEETDIIYFGENSNEDSFQSSKSIGLKDACEVINDHLLNLRSLDEATIRKAGETLHRQWFESAGSKNSESREVRNYIQYFEEFSNNLLKTLLHSVDSNGNNVLHFAFANNRFDLADEFLKNGLAADLLNKGNKNGNSPLMICSISQPKSNSEWSIVRKTFEMGNVNAMSLKSGQTPLMNASSCGFQAMVDLLLEIGANPNLQDKDGSTALMYAAEHGHETCIKSLMKHKKCDATIRDKDGETACSIALNNGHKNIVVLLHMHALEKRRTSKNSYFSKRCVRSNNKTNVTRKKALFTMPKPRDFVSSESL